MDLAAIIKELIEERAIMDRAIMSLERIALHRGKGRGRPPAWMAMLESEPPKAVKRGRPRKSGRKTK
jgi:hypothetical protein